MTVVRVELSNNSRLDLLLAFLRRLGSSDEIKVVIEEGGQGQAQLPSSAVEAEAEAHFETMIHQIIEDALAGRLERLTPEEEEREARELAAYRAEQADRPTTFSDDDIARLISEERRERRKKAFV